MIYIVTYVDSSGQMKYERVSADDVDGAKKLMRKKGVASTSCKFEEVDGSGNDGRNESPGGMIGGQVKQVVDEMSSKIDKASERIQAEGDKLIGDALSNNLGRISLLVSIQLFVLILIQLLGFLGAVMPARWEYIIESPSDLLFDSEMERLGNEGWELVTARRATSEYRSGASYEMIFKRRIDFWKSSEE